MTTYTRIQNGWMCDFADYRNYICFEHITYLFEFSDRFGPAWFSVPNEEEIDVKVDSLLWNMFEEWYENLHRKI